MITQIQVPTKSPKQLSNTQMFQELEAVRAAIKIAKAREAQLVNEVKAREGTSSKIGDLILSTTEPGETWDASLKQYALTSTSQRAKWLKTFLKPTKGSTRVLLKGKSS